MKLARKLIVAALILTTLAGNVPSGAQAAPNAIIMVQSAADDGTVNAANCPGVNCRLRDAIAYASAGDTITFSGDYTITLASQLTIDKDLTIDGTGHNITISGNHAVRVFYVNPGCTFNLQNLTVTGGNCGDNCYGDGLYNSADSIVNVVSIAFSDNINLDTSTGGGIFNDAGTVNVTNGTFTNNNTHFGSGIANWVGTVNVTDSTFSNHSALYGGGIYNQYGTLNVTSSIFSNNSASYAGGGIINDSGTLNVTSSSFISNSAPISGVPNNGYGGGINAYSGTTTVQNSTFISNSATLGGGLYSYGGATTVQNSTFSGNQAGIGGGLFNESSMVTLTNSSVSGNNTLGGGGIGNHLGTLNVMSSTVSQNSALYVGGGIMDDHGSLTVTNSTLFSNSVTINAGSTTDNGGGINTYSSTVMVQNSTFSGNSADWGGGLYVYSSTVTVKNSTFSDNPAIFGDGLAAQYGTVAVTNSTFSSNDTGNRGGIVSFPGTLLSMQNSIVATPHSSLDCVGAVTSQGYNIESGTNCGFTNGVNGDNQLLISGDSLNLQPLANNGVLPHPFTHALGIGSVAIDQIPDGVNGCAAGVSTDERGAVRAGGGTHGGARCDIGAYEVSDQGPNAVTLRDLTATATPSMGIPGAVGAALAALGTLLIGRRRATGS